MYILIDLFFFVPCLTSTFSLNDSWLAVVLVFFSSSSSPSSRLLLFYPLFHSVHLCRQSNDLLIPNRFFRE